MYEARDGDGVNRNLSGQLEHPQGETLDVVVSTCDDEDYETLLGWSQERSEKARYDVEEDMFNTIVYSGISDYEAARIATFDEVASMVLDSKSAVIEQTDILDDDQYEL